MLNDAHILKDVLRQYEGQDTHTVHLVYTPKNRPIVSSTTKTSNAKAKVSPEERHRPSPQSHSGPDSSFLSDGLR